MKKFFLFAILAAIVLCGFNCCEDPTFSDIVTYYGTVMDENTDLPYEGVDVKVTNGDRIHTTTQANADGYFSLEVHLQEINQDYYILIGNSGIGTKRVEFPGFGNSRYDLGIITIKGPSAPTVETSEVTNIKSKMAMGGGKVTSSGGFAVTKRGVCWSTSQYPTVTNDHTENGTGAGEFFSNIGNLQPSTTYYVRAYAENERGVAYGNQVTFQTESGVPTVTTKLVRVDNKTTVFCEGIVTDEGDSHIIARGICWGTSTPTITNQKTSDGDGTGAFSTSVTVTNVHAQYLYFRAYATNESGTAYGEVIEIDYRNPYNLFKVTDQKANYLVLPFDLARGYLDFDYNGEKDDRNTAFKYCKDLVAYDYDDWELPSLSVLQLMYNAKDLIGGFTNSDYWSSSYFYATDGMSYYYINFAKGEVSYSHWGLHCIRPVRKY